MLKTSLIITSIAGPDHPVLALYARECRARGLRFIVAGDTKSPSDFKLEGCEFLGIREQKQLPYSLAGLLPDRNYAKKNIAYLHAMAAGAEVIVETDDDNIPLPGFWEPRPKELSGHYLEGSGWTNAYAWYTPEPIWPRGFSLAHLRQPVPAGGAEGQGYVCPIQQGLVDENPDVDAIYRLVLKLPFRFGKNTDLVLGPGSICPFNSQSTTWFREAFPLLYLPSHCSFRMTDIWRSFVAQRILWTCGWNLAFHNATMYQERNAHDLMQDFAEELSGYLGNERLVAELMDLDLAGGPGNSFENLFRCYRKLIEKGYIGNAELPLLEAWIRDVQRIET